MQPGGVRGNRRGLSLLRSSVTGAVPGVCSMLAEGDRSSERADLAPVQIRATPHAPLVSMPRSSPRSGASKRVAGPVPWATCDRFLVTCDRKLATCGQKVTRCVPGFRPEGLETALRSGFQPHRVHPGLVVVTKWPRLAHLWAFCDQGAKISTALVHLWPELGHVWPTCGREMARCVRCHLALAHL